MISYSAGKYNRELKKMWKICFGDSSKFIRFYFENIYKEEETMVFFRENHPVASLQIIPYTIKLGMREVKAGYISGAMTLPEYRKQGIMEQLLYFAFEEMKKKGMELSFLIPQNERIVGYYKRFDYREAFPLLIQRMKTKEIAEASVSSIRIVKSFSESDADRWYPDYFRFLRQHENAVLKTKAHFELFLKELLLDNGRIFLAENAGGMAFVTKNKDNCIVKELVYEDECTKNKLLYSIKKKYRCAELNLYLRDPRFRHQSAGMIKVLNRETFPGGIPENVYMSMMMD